MPIRVEHNTYNNDWYKKEIGASRITQILWYFVNVVFFVNPLNLSVGLKISLLKLFGAKIGRKVVIKPAVNIKYPWKLAIGDYSWIGEKVWIDNLTEVIIGQNVCISQGAMILTGNHNYKKSTFDLIIGKVQLEDGVWLGARSLVCPGVTCKSHSILTTLSVATFDLEPYMIYQGNPARVIRERKIDLAVETNR